VATIEAIPGSQAGEVAGEDLNDKRVRIPAASGMCDAVIFPGVAIVDPLAGRDIVEREVYKMVLHSLLFFLSASLSPQSPLLSHPHSPQSPTQHKHNYPTQHIYNSLNLVPKTQTQTHTRTDLYILNIQTKLQYAHLSHLHPRRCWPCCHSSNCAPGSELPTCELQQCLPSRGQRH